MSDFIRIDGVQRPTTNSLGKRIARTDEQIAAFWRWFGDSKVVDEQGRPLVVYHGSPKQFDVFDTNKIGQAHGRSEGAGFYFTTSKETAASYAEGGEPMAVYLQIDKPIAYNAPGFKPSQIKRALLAVAKIESERDGSDQRDGFLANFGDTYSASIQSVAAEAARLIANDATAVDQLGGIVGSGVPAEIVNEAVRKSLGFDGYVSIGFSNAGGDGGVIWVATAPTQIKSATGNRGTFDPNDPVITNPRTNPPIPYEPTNPAGMLVLRGFRPTTQQHDYTCGPACLRAVLAWKGTRLDEATLAALAGTTARHGTTPAGMMSVLHRATGTPVMRRGASLAWCLRQLRRDRPVLLLWNDWKGHWVVLIGYDPTTKRVLLADPANRKTGLRVHTYATLAKHWQATVAGRHYRRLAIAVS